VSPALLFMHDTHAYTQRYGLLRHYGYGLLLQTATLN